MATAAAGAGSRLGAAAAAASAKQLKNLQDLINHVSQVLPAASRPHVTDILSTRRSGSFRVSQLKIPDPAAAPQVATALQAHLQLPQPPSSVPWYPWAFTTPQPLKAGPSLEGLEAYDQGQLYLQSLSSMLPALCLDVKPGMKVLDLCAAPGGKTSLLAELMSNQGHILANDLKVPRMQRLQANLTKLLGPEHIVSLCQQDGRYLRVDSQGMPVMDEALATPDPRGVFDRVLVDVPCSSSGRVCLAEPRTYEHWALADLPRYSQRQQQLLYNAIRLLRPGGILVYSTCSVSPEENEAVVQWALTHIHEMKVLDVTLPAPGNPKRLLLDWLEKDAPGTASPGLLTASPAAGAGGTARSRLSGAMGAAGRSYLADVAKSVRILPSSLYEGFFICKMQKLRSRPY